MSLYGHIIMRITIIVGAGIEGAVQIANCSSSLITSCRLPTSLVPRRLFKKRAWYLLSAHAPNFCMKLSIFRNYYIIDGLGLTVM